MKKALHRCKAYQIVGSGRESSLQHANFQKSRGTLYSFYICVLADGHASEINLA